MRHNSSSHLMFPPWAWGPAFPLSSPPCLTECRTENSYAGQMPSEGTGMGGPQKGKAQETLGVPNGCFWILLTPYSLLRPPGGDRVCL